MKTIDTLREIVNNKEAKVLLFNPPEKPVAESLEVVCQDREMFEIFPTKEEQEARAGYEKDRLLVDMQTAHAMVLVYDAIKPMNQEKADRLMTSKSGFLRVAEIAWGAVKTV